MKKRKEKALYPGVKQVEEIKNKIPHNYIDSTLPDFIGNAPNYDKFKNWSVEKTLVWLNID